MGRWPLPEGHRPEGGYLWHRDSFQTVPPCSNKRASSQSAGGSRREEGVVIKMLRPAYPNR